MKKLKWFLFTIIFLFTIPLGAQFIPYKKEQQIEQLVLAAQEPIEAQKSVLVYFTHSTEAYEPIVQASTGKKVTSHDQYNIRALSEPIKELFSKQSLQVDTLETDIAKTMKLSNSKYTEAYAVARPYVKNAIAEKNYDLIIDIHRDSVKKAATTLKNEQGSFAKIAFVVGLEHPTYSWNLAYAEQLHNELNTLMPGISRGVLKKEGEGVNGVYNQDLAPNVLLLEIGGVGNTEEELLQTLDLLAQAIRQLLIFDQPSEQVL